MCDEVKMGEAFSVEETGTEAKKSLSQRRLEARLKLELRKDQAMLREQLGDDYDDLLESS